jgi:hypothetical protein
MGPTRGFLVAVVALALSACPVAGADPDNSDMPTGPLDPRCQQYPTDAVCQGGPYALPPPPPPPPAPAFPTGPLDPQCMQMPADAACVGSPYVPQPPPAPPVEPVEPHMDSGMPAMPAMPTMPGHI